jgi:hypothetical protein
MQIKRAKLKSYLEKLYGSPLSIKEIRLLGRGFHAEAHLVVFEAQGKPCRLVLKFLRGEGFGHDYSSDRAQVLLYSHQVFDKLPSHIRSLDVGYLSKDGSMKSSGDYDEFFIILDEAEGRLYIEDMNEIRARGSLTERDLQRAGLLSDYLAEIHRVKHSSPTLYARRIRDLVGHGECIMGVLDSCYPHEALSKFTSEKELEEIEKRCVEWRWRLRGLKHRLAQVHGDYHPFNILFSEDGSLLLMDRSRGEWGEPGDDVSCLSANYVWYSVMDTGGFEDPFRKLFLAFFESYMKKTGDYEMLKVLAPFYAFRMLVIASPLYYPHTPNETRRKLFNFTLNVLNADEFDPEQVGSYLKG